MAKRKKIEDLDKNLKLKTPKKTSTIRWFGAGSGKSEIRGLAWHDKNKGKFCRLPLRAEGVVRDPVWALAQSTAGARVCFKTDSTRLQLRATLNHDSRMAHMPATGQSGFALYEGEPGRMRTWGVAFPGVNEVTFEREFFQNVEKTMREFTVYLPLYNGVQSIELGIDRGAKLQAPSKLAHDKPAVIYGTSITQGGCAHTSDADYPSILGRMLQIDTVNLGFSGNGQGEPEMATIISEIDAAVYVLDYVANVDAKKLKRTLPKFIEILRKKRKTTPIILASRIVFSQCTWNKGTRQDHEDKRDIMIETYAKMRRKGDRNIHFIDGNTLIPYGQDLAYSDAGVHPTTYGFEIMARVMAPQLEAIMLPRC
ncbi:MAG: SGNH/GDSL hydrolase family protein [Planctomycetota bacterium]